MIICSLSIERTMVFNLYNIESIESPLSWDYCLRLEYVCKLTSCSLLDTLYHRIYVSYFLTTRSLCEIEVVLNNKLNFLLSSIISTFHEKESDHYLRISFKEYKGISIISV